MKTALSKWRSALWVARMPAAVFIMVTVGYFIFRKGLYAGEFRWAESLDKFLYKAVDAERSLVWTGLARLLDILGSGPFEYMLLGVIGFTLVRRGHTHALVAWAAALTSGWAVNLMLKELFHRSRPLLERGVPVMGFSFPSGHAMVSTIFYGMLVYGILLRNEGRLWRFRWAAWAALALFLLAMGWSRVYLRVHYASDAVAGMAAGTAWLLLWLLPLRRYRWIEDAQRSHSKDGMA
jgi:undecaprenyl-diphosphatase